LPSTYVLYLRVLARYKFKNQFISRTRKRLVNPKIEQRFVSLGTCTCFRLVITCTARRAGSNASSDAAPLPPRNRSDDVPQLIAPIPHLFAVSEPREDPDPSNIRPVISAANGCESNFSHRLNPAIDLQYVPRSLACGQTCQRRRALWSDHYPITPKSRSKLARNRSPPPCSVRIDAVDHSNHQCVPARQ